MSNKQPRFSINPFRGNEFIVLDRYGNRIGTIRQFGASWGWLEHGKKHVYSTKQRAATACYLTALTRKARQRQRADEARHTAA